MISVIELVFNGLLLLVFIPSHFKIKMTDKLFFFFFSRCNLFLGEVKCREIQSHFLGLPKTWDEIYHRLISMRLVLEEFDHRAPFRLRIYYRYITK